MISSDNGIVTIRDLIKTSSDILKNNKIDSFAVDARIIISHFFLGKYENSHNIIMHLDENVSISMAEKIIDTIKLRAKNYPVAYILGYKYFWNYSFYVNEHVLIPRPDSELIIDSVNKHFADKKNNAHLIMDIGTGSGCLIVTLLKCFENANGIGIDISSEAIKIAKANSTKMGVQDRLKFIESDISIYQHDDESPHIIISNPPYISAQEMPELASSVRNFEPRIALTDENDGLSFYRYVAKFVKQIIHKNTYLFLEIGYDQSSAVKNIFLQNSYNIIDIVKDINNIDRVIIIKL